MGRREGANASVGALKIQIWSDLDSGWQLMYPPQAQETTHVKRQSWGVAALHTSRKMRDARAEGSPGQATSAACKTDVFSTTEATLGQRQGSHSSSSASVNGNQA